MLGWRIRAIGVWTGTLALNLLQKIVHILKKKIVYFFFTSIIKSINETSNYTSKLNYYLRGSDFIYTLCT